jgi:hypothetical protein
MKYQFDIHGNPSGTERIVATDVAQQFTAAQYNSGNNPAVAVLLTCETNQIRFCLGGDTPTQGANGLGHILYVGQSLRITNPHAIRTFSFINHTNGSNAILQASFEFAIGV